MGEESLKTMTERQFHRDDSPDLHSRAEENISDGANRNAHEREIERLNRLYAALSELNQIIVRVKSRDELFHEGGRSRPPEPLYEAIPPLPKSREHRPASQ